MGDLTTTDSLLHPATEDPEWPLRGPLVRRHVRVTLRYGAQTHVHNQVRLNVHSPEATRQQGQHDQLPDSPIDGQEAIAIDTGGLPRRFRSSPLRGCGAGRFALDQLRSRPSR